MAPRPGGAAFPGRPPGHVFDGKCVFCSGFAQFVLRHDRRRRFRMLAAQTPLGTALYRHFGLDPVAYETNILLADGHAWFKSAASLRIFAGLGLPWSLLGVFRLFPSALREPLYDLVARNRYRWFGVRDACYLPDPAEADRFIA